MMSKENNKQCISWFFIFYFFIGIGIHSEPILATHSFFTCNLQVHPISVEGAKKG